jgi:hypothetical protein
MHHWIIYGLMVIAVATYCVVFGFGPVFVACECIRRMRSNERHWSGAEDRGGTLHPKGADAAEHNAEPELGPHTIAP